MPRIARMKVKGEPTVYNVISRTALDGFALGDVEREFMLNHIKRLSRVYFAEVHGFCIMGNHFHLLIQMFPEHYFTDDEVRKRCKAYFGKDYEIIDEQIGYYRKKLS